LASYKHVVRAFRILMRIPENGCIDNGARVENCNISNRARLNSATIGQIDAISW
jgi:hypothetical protein